MRKGKAYLVGAGPGDIGLITVKGLEAIKKADVILYDRLANPKLLDFAPASCEMIYCGKLPDRHSLRQDHINDLLVSKTAEGNIVVRLKGGDPGVFGRVGEEAEALASKGLSFEMVPGISSGIAAPLYAGIPVTHREYGETFAIVTAHDKSKDGRSSLNWEGLAKGIDTIAFYMGVRNLPHICDNLIKFGKSPHTPVILIQWGTFGRQRTLEGTLETIVTRVQEENFTNPAITLVGNIVSLRNKISWFENKPLYGKEILLARTGTEESELANGLRDAGADVIEFPKWKREKQEPSLEILASLPNYRSILFTSPEVVDEFFEMLIVREVDIRSITANFYAHSKRSLEKLRSKGIIARLYESNQQEGPLLVVSSTKENEDVMYSNDKEEMDFLITSKIKLDRSFLPILKRSVVDAKINSIVFPSSASVEMFMGLVEETNLLNVNNLKDLSLHCLGSKTKQTLEQFGLSQILQTDEPNLESLKASLLGEIR